ncbi:hypothetical protein GRS48_06600 [Halorubrum sp. JWXQ-INN 858]|nr:hypothetical protein [Halorubrum sp. JWXQ-INN 858]MWV64494.1 hypothetical protein [Halorubrum sp. JWXQ-INN 858]
MEVDDGRGAVRCVPRPSSTEAEEDEVRCGHRGRLKGKRNDLRILL